MEMCMGGRRSLAVDVVELLKLLSALFFDGAEKGNKDGVVSAADKEAFFYHDAPAHSDGKRPPHGGDIGFPNDGPLLCR